MAGWPKVTWQSKVTLAVTVCRHSWAACSNQMLEIGSNWIWWLLMRTITWAWGKSSQQATGYADHFRLTLPVYLINFYLEGRQPWSLRAEEYLSREVKTCIALAKRKSHSSWLFQLVYMYKLSNLIAVLGPPAICMLSYPYVLPLVTFLLRIYDGVFLTISPLNVALVNICHSSQSISVSGESPALVRA